ncbi:MAG: type I 3-dehydroquinate dehydratase [bacterium]|nr:type I 3-dehydroquinate dehydratase [bacterium]
MDLKVVGVLSYFPLESAYIRGCKKYNDIIEVRADLIGEKYQEAIEKFTKIKPILLTVRSEKEGGVYVPSRKEIYIRNIDKVEFIDIELSSIHEMQFVVHHARAKKKKVILSYHSFDSIPKERELDKLVQRAELANADMFKAAIFTLSHKTIVELCLWLRKITFKKTLDLCVMCMGSPKISLISRIVFPVFGSKLVYGKLGKASAAPGQPDSFLLYKILKEERYS